MSHDPALESIAERAAAWFARVREGDLAPGERAAFARWLGESPVHVREYLGIAELWGGLQAGQPWPEDSTEALLGALAGQGNVVPLAQAAGNGQPGAPATATAAAAAAAGTGVARRPGSSPDSRRPGRRRWLAVAAACALAAAAGALLLPVLRPPSYQTARGEQRAVVLPDGSVVQLNTLSRIVVRFDGQRRRIRLTEGEAFFRVAHDARRPFDVETRDAVVRAVGTEFNVYEHAAGTRVAVIEGKVQVASAKSAGARTDVPRIALGPRQSAEVGRDEGVKPLPAPRAASAARHATAWMQRRIFLENDRVDEAVAEFNRYNRLQMSVDDPQLAALRISGVFSADDPHALMKYLRQIQRVDVREEQGGFVLRR